MEDFALSRFYNPSEIQLWDLYFDSRVLPSLLRRQLCWLDGSTLCEYIKLVKMN